MGNDSSGSQGDFDKQKLAEELAKRQRRRARVDALRNGTQMPAATNQSREGDDSGSGSDDKLHHYSSELQCVEGDGRLP